MNPQDVEMLDTESNSKPEAVEKVSPLPPPPDGGYGWIVLACVFMSSAATWGMNTSNSIYLSFFIANNQYPGATSLQYTFVVGMSFGLTLFVSPLANWLSKRFHFKVPMILGTCLFSGAYISAAYATQVWQLFVTIGVMSGFGSMLSTASVGLVFIPMTPLTQQWFDKKRALAAGLGAGGSGFGGLIFSITNRILIERHGTKWAFIANGLTSLAILVPVIFFARSRSRIISAKFEPLQLSMIKHPSFSWALLWAIFSQFGYGICLYTIPTYATQALGFTQSQAAVLQAVFSAGQMLGRPTIGIALDTFGRINMSALATFVTGLEILLIWINARTFGVMIFFAVVNGFTSGVFWSAAAPVTSECVGVQDLGSALAILWLSVVIPCLFGPPIASALADYSKDVGRTGVSAYLPSVGFSGSCFIIASVLLLPAKFRLQGSYRMLQKT